MEIDIYVDEEGAQLIYTDEVAGLLDGEPAVTRRASYVEPGLGGGWLVDLTPAGGPMAGPFALRAEALAWELVWLAERLEQGRLVVRL